MSTPNWSPAVSSTQAFAAQVNQELATHNCQFMYHGLVQISNGINGGSTTVIASDYATSVATTAVPTNTGSAAQWIDQPFTTGSSQTTVSRVVLLPFGVGSGADVTISLETNNASNQPSGTSLASVTLPLDFTASSLYTSSSHTTYTSTSVTDTAGTFPYYGGNGGSPAGNLPIELILGWVLVAGTSFAIVTGNATNNTSSVGTTQWFNYTTGASSTPASATIYSAYPVISVPLPATGLSASTLYHLVISGTASTSNYVEFANTANVSGEVVNTGTSATGPWTTTTSKTLFFGVFANGGTGNKSTSLRNTWEDGGVRWTGIDYWLIDEPFSTANPLIVREYTGTFRNQALATYSSTSTATASPTTVTGLLQSIT